LDLRKRKEQQQPTEPKSTVHFGSVSDITTEAGSESVNKYENVSDNGSEISDEGYRSLGIIQTGNNVEKRVSLYSQASNEDADNSGEWTKKTFVLFVKM
jgi:hypothetical protein